MNAQKKCHKCGVVKSTHHFNINRVSPDGRQTQCKKCEKAYKDKIREANKPKSCYYSKLDTIKAYGFHWNGGQWDESVVSDEFHLNRVMVELKVMAEKSNDSNMINEYLSSNPDLHLKTAKKTRELQGKATDITKQKNKKERQIGKHTNFGSIYGQKENGLIDFFLKYDIIISRSEASLFLKAFFSLYPSVAVYHEGVQEYCKRYWDQWIVMESAGGRKRWWPPKSMPYYSNDWGGFVQCNDAINHPIQSTIADIVALAEKGILKYLRENNLLPYVKPILQIHDSLIFYVHKSVVDVFTYNLKRIMIESGETLIKTVPVTVDVDVGWNWAFEDVVLE